MPNYDSLLGTGDTVLPLSKAMAEGDEKRSKFMVIKHQLNRVKYKTQEAKWATDTATALIVELRTQVDKATWQQIKEALDSPLSISALIRQYQPAIQAYLDSIDVRTTTHTTPKGYEVKVHDWSEATEQPRKTKPPGRSIRLIDMKGKDNEDR